LDLASIHQDNKKQTDFQNEPSINASLNKGSLADVNDPKLELGMWLISIRSFLQTHNHPFPENDYSAVLNHNWKYEVKVVCRCLLRTSQLALSLVHQTKKQNSSQEKTEDLLGLNALLDSTEEESKNLDDETSHSLLALSEGLGNLYSIGEALLESRTVSFQTWCGFGSVLAREMNRSEGANKLARFAIQSASTKLPPIFHKLTHEKIQNEMVGYEIKLLFEQLSRLLEWLKFIEQSFEKDQPLKQTLPIFTLVNQESETLMDLIDNRVMKLEGLPQDLFDTLDGTSYATRMELKKVFARELIGISSVKHSPTIYGKLESAHGLLRNSFQQSAVVLAQFFDASLDGARMFDNFQTRLEQSLLLRKELWVVLNIVRKAEQLGEVYSTAKLNETLLTFRNGSMRFLMFKDWEACERFIDEVVASRGTVELTPILHRLGAYLETLHGQVCMRAVLAEHPFDYPSVDI
jgi:hypothetical protein